LRTAFCFGGVSVLVVDDVRSRMGRWPREAWVHAQVQVQVQVQVQAHAHAHAHV
jgi:hypothetical protein